MNALITSFARSHSDHVGPVYSAAVYQPKGYNFEKAEWCDIRDERGQWIRPRNFLGHDDPLVSYHQSLLNLYAGRRENIREWLAARSPFWTNFTLCCWCPYDQAAQRQLAEHGSFVCHTAVIGEVLEELGVRVWYDSDRLKMKVLP